MTITKKTHPSHPEHEVELKNYKKPYTCDGCKEQGFGSRYQCELCGFNLHEKCMFPTPTASHDFFEGDNFEFLNEPLKKCGKSDCNKCETYCDACGKTVNGFVYHCEEDNKDLHPCCHDLENELRIDGVLFRLRAGVSSRCFWCKKRKLHGSGAPGWSYVSKCENYHFHVYCATEMVLDGWKRSTGNDCLTLENVDLQLVKARKRGGGSNKYWKIAKMFLKALACILLGDPTITLACLLVESFL